MRRELLTFVLVGVAATLTHIGVAISLEYVFGCQPQLANLGGYLSAVGVSYFGHGRLTFRSADRHAVRFPRFIVVSLVGLALGSALVEVLAVRNEVPFAYVMIIAGVVVASTTFLLSKFWAFAQAQFHQ